MKDILDRKAGSMDISTFSSMQTCKYFLKSKASTSQQVFRREEINHTPVKSSLMKINMLSARKKYHNDLSAKKEKRDVEFGALSLTKKHLKSAASAKKDKETEALPSESS